MTLGDRATLRARQSALRCDLERETSLPPAPPDRVCARRSTSSPRDIPRARRRDDVPGTVTEALRAPPSAAPTAMFDGTRPLKRWRYVGIFCEQFMACAAIVHVGPLKQSFWALYERDRGELRDRTRMLPRRSELALGPGRICVRDRGVSLELELTEERGIEALCPHGRGIVWTRKQAGVAAHGSLALDGGPPQPVRARAVIDDTAGHHARHTEWHWSAGVGEGPDGRALAWNLVSGVNDPPQGSERAVWVRAAPGEPTWPARRRR